MKQIIFTLFIMSFLWAGCAHQPVTDASHKMGSDQTEIQDAETESEIEGYGSDNEDEDLDFLYEEAKEGVSDVADPLAPWNRAMFQFNDKLYFWVLKPISIGYKTVIPTVARKGVRNFFHNLRTPPRLINALLQIKGKGAWSEFSRFIVNTTVGILGFWDPAEKYLSLEPCEEDLGQTLGFYGVGNGIYIVWPILGSSTLRDTFGKVGDSFLDPVTYIEPMEAALGVRGVELINETSLSIGDYESFKEDYYYPYEAFRNSYIQHREKKVNE